MVGMRKLMGGGLAAMLIVVFTPAAAYAWGESLQASTSAIDTAAFKAETVSCPEDTVVIGMGGLVREAAGGAVLVGLMPNSALTAVTATAKALPGNTQPWGVTVTALCAPAGDYQPVAGLASGAGSAQETCPEGKVVYSTGFFVSGQGTNYVYSVVPSANGRHATVRAAGTVVVPTVTVRPVCGNEVHPYGRTASTIALNPGRLTAGTAPPLTWTSWVAGAGVHTDQPGFFVDAVTPYVQTDGSLAARARLARLPGTLLPLRSLRAAATSDGDATFYGTSIGSWY